MDRVRLRIWCVLAWSLVLGLAGGIHGPGTLVRGDEPAPAAVRQIESGNGTRELGVPAAVDRPDSAFSRPVPLTPRSNQTGSRQLLHVRPYNASLQTVIASLGLVLAAFLLIAWLTKKHGPRGAAALPPEVVELLGRAPLAGRQQLQLLRLGNKLVLLNVAPHGSEPLCEITDPDEVQRLVGLCQQTSPTSISHAFRQVLAQAEQERGEWPAAGRLRGGRHG